MDLSPQEIEKYKQQGYTEEEIREAYSNVKQKMVTGNNDSFKNSATSTFAGRNNQNIVMWQLEVDSILEKVEHMLRGDYISYEGGNAIWKRNKDPEARTFNETGVREIMLALQFYLNRNTILSNYEENKIELAVYDLAEEVNDLIYMNYDRYGLDTSAKRKRYPSVVLFIRHSVESAYLRALHGGERESLSKSIQVTQNESGHNIGGGNQIVKERSVINPMRYFGGKYKYA